MEHSEIILIALILLIVFAGFQIEKLFSFLKGNVQKQSPVQPVPVKTVLPAAQNVVLKKKATVRKKKALTTTKKKTVSKKRKA